MHVGFHLSVTLCPPTACQPSTFINCPSHFSGLFWFALLRFYACYYRLFKIQISKHNKI